MQANRDIGVPYSEAADMCMLSECARAQGDAASSLAHAQASLAVYVRLSDQYGQAMAWDHIGHAHRAAGAWAEALAAFEKALAMYDAVDDATGRRAARAQVAEAHLERGDGALALPLVERVLSDVEQADEREDGILLALICHRVLAAVQDPRADRLLVQAHRVMQSRVARVADPAVRARMLDRIPAHRAVAEAWSRRIAPAAP